MDNAVSRTGRHRAPLHASCHPVEVFESLAVRSVPDLCDDCSIDLIEYGAEGLPRFRRISVPPPAAATGSGLERLQGRAVLASDHVVRIRFDSPVGEGEQALLHAFGGVATFVWERRAASRLDQVMAAVSVDDAVHTVMWQRSVDAAQSATKLAANLHIALENSRQIGAAIGILMQQRKVTEDAAFDLLRVASQRANRKLRDLALEVIETGCLDTRSAGRATW